MMRLVGAQAAGVGATAHRVWLPGAVAQPVHCLGSSPHTAACGPGHWDPLMGRDAQPGPTAPAPVPAAGWGSASGPTLGPEQLISDSPSSQPGPCGAGRSAGGSNGSEWLLMGPMEAGAGGAVVSASAEPELPLPRISREDARLAPAPPHHSSVPGPPWDRYGPLLLLPLPVPVLPSLLGPRLHGLLPSGLMEVGGPCWGRAQAWWCWGWSCCSMSVA